MSRTINIPASSVTEGINDIQEIPGNSVRFLVGILDNQGNFVIGQNFQIFVVSGDDYTELNGPPTTWAPDKPTGTYRNDDLWHYVDKQRSI